MEELKIVIATELNIDPKTAYNAWLDSEEHEQMTGGAASFTKQVGAEFTAWDGYIFGKILELTPDMRVLQTWRTTEFDESTPDSTVEVTFAPSENGTLLTLTHTNLDSEASVEKYRTGWEQHYIQPMLEHFNS
ncbi:MAG: hypothetical protein ACI8ZM_001108 [Crocinitomix sp.]|jgi:uncharacterized protein YndB with AHSA1/START domain